MSQPSAPPLPGLRAPYFSRTSYTLLGAHYITAFVGVKSKVLAGYQRFSAARPHRRTSSQFA